MNYFNRQIDNTLVQWCNDKRHKPLMLRGADVAADLQSAAIVKLGFVIPSLI